MIKTRTAFILECENIYYKLIMGEKVPNTGDSYMTMFKEGIIAPGKGGAPSLIDHPMKDFKSCIGLFYKDSPANAERKLYNAAKEYGFID